MSKPLRIGLFMQGGRDWMGGSEYIRNVIFALASLPPETRQTFEVSLIYGGSLDSEFRSRIESHVTKIYSLADSLEPLSYQNRLRWKLDRVFQKYKKPRFQSFLRKEGFDFLYPYVDEDVEKGTYRSAACIYDFQHKYLPHFYTEEALKKRDQEFSLIAHYSPQVILNSKSAESDFHQYFPDGAHKAIALPFKVSIDPAWYEGNPTQVQQTYCLPDRFFLVSNQFWQHKNHLLIFEALRLLKERAILPTVVCTGHIHDNRKPDYSDFLLQTIHKFGIAKQVCLLGLIPKFDQIQLMRKALCLLQPSLFEGWSTIVEEARCFAKPMLLSDLPVNIEQNPPNSSFFDRHSAEQLATLMEDAWLNLKEGPDLEGEAIAHAKNLREVETFGSRFLEIARGHKITP